MHSLICFAPSMRRLSALDHVHAYQRHMTHAFGIRVQPRLIERKYSFKSTWSFDWDKGWFRPIKSRSCVA